MNVTCKSTSGKIDGFRRVSGAIAGIGAIAMALMGAASAEEYRWGGRVETPQATTTRLAPKSASATKPTHVPSGPILRISDIAGLKIALNLTPEQRPHWPAVEAALSNLARQQARAEATNYVQRVKDRASALAETAAQLRRLQSVAGPLMNSLNETQKRAAVGFARRMGYGPLLNMF